MTLLTFLASILFVAISVLAQNDTSIALITENNPIRVTFQAQLQIGKPVQGQISGVSNDNGTGVVFNVNFFSFPDVTLGPFSKLSPQLDSSHLPLISPNVVANGSADNVNVGYHIHQYPISPSGNCTTAGGHLSPFGRTDQPPCDDIHPETCQPGDLSGKHGTISQLAQATAGDGSSDNNVASVSSFQARYLELYVSTDSTNVEYFGNRSVVVHSSNGTRLNCANFTQQMSSETFGGNGGNNATNTTTSPASSTPTHGGAASSMEILKTQIALVLGMTALALAMGFL